jgi:hypothetical protein
MIPPNRLPLLARAPGTRPSLTLTGLLAGLLVGISAAVFTPSAHAAVVMIDLNDTRNDGSNVTIAGPNAGLTSGSGVTIVNWLGLGTAAAGIELIVNHGSGSGGTYTGFSGADSLHFAAPVPPNETDVGPRKFAFGDQIDASLDPLFWTQDPYNTFFMDSSIPIVAPIFAPGSYVGFRFSDLAGNAYHYGYLEVTWNGTDFEILSGAYESTVDTGIDAGDTGATVPDSSSTGLMGLLFAGAAVRQWRKSRR